MNGALSGTAAALYALLALGVAGFQAALAAGAPWAELPMGQGRRGRLPPPQRVAAGVQAVLQLGLILVVMGAAGLTGWSGPGWVIWVAVGLAGLAMVLNRISPSEIERRIWSPVAGGMLATSGIVAAGW